MVKILVRLNKCMRIECFDDILVNCLESKNLRYIRFKVDPTINKGFKESESYEGYILHELSCESCGGPTIGGIPPILKILMTGGAKPGIHDVRKPIITPTKPGAIAIFKQFIFKKLNGSVGSKELELIKNSNNINDIELYLKQGGLTDADLLNLYKKVLSYA